MDVAQRGDDHVEVVEEPLGRGRRGLAAFGVVGQRSVHLAKDSRVLTEALQVHAAAAARAPGDGEQRRQSPRMLLEPLETEEFDRSWRTRSAAITRFSLILVRAEIGASLGVHGAIVPRSCGPL